MILRIKLIVKRVWGIFLIIFLDTKKTLKKWGSPVRYPLYQPNSLSPLPFSCMLVVRQGEGKDQKVLIRSSLILRSEEGHSVTFRWNGAWFEIRSKGLKMVSE